MLGRALSVSVLNQVVSSGTNFALGLYLVRVLTPPEFGLYGIGFAVTLFYASIGNALFLTQMVVHAPDKAPEERLPYAGRILVLVVLFCVTTLFLAGLMLVVDDVMWVDRSTHADFSIAVTAASVATLLKNFFVRHAFNARREAWSLIISGALAASLVGMLWAQALHLDSLSVETAMWIYAFAQGTGAMAGYLLARLPVTRHGREALIAALREVWDGGRWASISSLVSFLRTQAHTIVVAFLMGPVGVATLNAARLLVNPAVMLIPALGQVAIPRLAALRAQGARQVIKGGLTATSVLLAVALVYCAVLLCNYDTAVGLALGDRYHDLFTITLLWCVLACLLTLRHGAEMSAQVLRRFKALSAVNTVCALLSLTATYSFTAVYGLTGSLVGLLIGDVALVILLYSILTRARRLRHSSISTRS